MNKPKRKLQSAGGPEPHAPRILLWDIETDGLQADRILCIGFKWFGDGGSNLLTYDQFRGRDPWWSDRKLLQAFSEVFEQCDYHVTWYGSGFDLPVVSGRLVQHGLPPLAKRPHIDLWKTAREKLGHKRQGHRLQAWQDRLGLKEDKSPVKPSVWIAARHGDRDALKYIYTHCRQDVLVLEGVYKEFKPWVAEPARALFTGDEGGCPSCGSHHIQRRGFQAAQTRIYQQWGCKDCGHRFRSASAVGKSRWRS